MADFITRGDRTSAITAGIVAGAQDALAEGLDALLDDVRARSRVDTGEMRDTWHTLSNLVSGEASGELHSGADHTEFNEWGTEKMSAQPMATPAAESEKGRFADRVTRKVRERLR